MVAAINRHAHKRGMIDLDLLSGEEPLAQC